MAIKKKQVASRRLTAGNTLEAPGSDTKIKQQSPDDLKNNMLPEMLEEPPEDKGGSTYTSVSAKAQPKQTQAQRIAARRRMLAAEETTNVGTMDNEVTDNQLGPELEEQPLDLENNMSPEALLLAAASDEDDDWDAPVEPEDAEDAAEDIEDDVDADEVGASDEPAFEVEDEMPEGEAQDLVDIDETPDDDVSDVVFAAVNGRLSVIKANRIIATMTERRAIKAKVVDFYLGDQFQEVTAHALDTKGLRQGLKSMGFVMATVNVAKNTVVAARVKALASKTTASVRAQQQEQAKIMEQSLAIASVGVNRRFFKGYENPLKDAITAALITAGVRNASRLVNACFAQHGTAYAQSIVALATKISADTDEVRDNYADSLDLTSGEIDEDVVPVGAGDDNGDPGSWDDADDVADVDQDFAADISVEGALATAGVRRQLTASTQSNEHRNKGQYSVHASRIIAGDAPLFSL